jgi:hypothetical protein
MAELLHHRHHIKEKLKRVIKEALHWKERIQNIIKGYRDYDLED